MTGPKVSSYKKVQLDTRPHMTYISTIMTSIANVGDKQRALT